ncbi:MAG: 5-methyltetrahydropteroyltriglutamate--homocysteine S-methyltransferase, partial [Betaproteobacteria bacterium]|nr:5-methyltetrahydropteroyltriglutamate--homocysteine S-methyltransferase [Betaproteobacteria bacterium]
MAKTHILGFPRIGEKRELKFALESFWRGEADSAYLSDLGHQLRQRHWSFQRKAGLDMVAAGDFALYDQMLNQTVLLGALPKRFGFDAKTLTLEQYSQLARGNKTQHAMEMTKWFDTNYHYLVPELSPDTRFDGGVEWFPDDVLEAMATGAKVKPVLIGPVTYLWLSKTHVAGFDRLSLLPSLLIAYQRILEQLTGLGVEWVQVDEPALCLELPSAWINAFDDAYVALRDSGVKLLLAMYFDDAGEHAERVCQLPVSGVHIDAVRAPQQVDAWRCHLSKDAVLSVGIIDGRNIWRTDLRRTLNILRPLHEALGDRLWIAPSCSLLHVPVSLNAESQLDAEIKNWLAFATEKLSELNTLARALNTGDAAVVLELAESDAAQASRRQCVRVTNDLVQKRLAALTDAMAERA